MTMPLFNSDASYQANKALLEGVYSGLEAGVSNIANRSTPNYERVCVTPDFKESLSKALRSGKGQVQLPMPNIVKDTSPLRKNAMGNNVDLEKELIDMKELGMKQQYFTFCLGNTLKQIQAAASGRGV